MARRSEQEQREHECEWPSSAQLGAAARWEIRESEGPFEDRYRMILSGYITAREGLEADMRKAGFSPDEINHVQRRAWRAAWRA